MGLGFEGWCEFSQVEGKERGILGGRGKVSCMSRGAERGVCGGGVPLKQKRQGCKAVLAGSCHVSVFSRDWWDRCRQWETSQWILHAQCGRGCPELRRKGPPAPGCDQPASPVP